jgi:transitional endoplasmic reticulum ATPase
MKNDFIENEIIETTESLHNAVPGFEKICRRWSLIALGSLGGGGAIIRNHGCNNIPLLDSLKIKYENEEGLYDKLVAEKSLKDSLELAIQEEPVWPKSSSLLVNIKWLQDVLGLNATEASLVTLVILERQDTILSQSLEALGGLNNSRMYYTLCQLLNVSEIEIRSALSPSSILFRTGLLRLDGRVYNFEHKIDLITGIAEKMITIHGRPFDLFANNFIAGTHSLLELENYSHIKDDICYLKEFLSEKLNAAQFGINVLVYGPPGTGKTEMVRMLADELSADLYEIATETEDGTRLTSADRLKSYQLSQWVLNQASDSLILFDEVEDVFSGHYSNFQQEEMPNLRGNTSGQKAWFNKLLEDSCVPTFWLTNNINDIDPAHLRRFNYHLQINVPPRSVRERIVESYAKPLGLSKECMQQIARHENLSPAVIESSSNVAIAIQSSGSKRNMEEVMNRLISNAMRALGNSSTVIHEKDTNITYDPNVLNTKCNLTELIEGLRLIHSARLCMYGPPGTGKTAFARYLSEQLDLPLLVRRGSDILGSYVGQTERNIAAAFEQAREEGAILLIDEADSFLMDRGSATRRWEVSGVNEMLTNMEVFQGIFIASTNLMDQMDSASLRRFDAKVFFDFLKPTQALLLFRQSCKQIGLDMDVEADKKILSLDILTPGDFAAVMRQSRLLRLSSAEEFAEKLEQECALKPQGKRNKMGF